MKKAADNARLGVATNLYPRSGESPAKVALQLWIEVDGESINSLHFNAWHPDITHGLASQLKQTAAHLELLERQQREAP